MGEGLTNDELIMPFISSCNIACGFHAGDPETIVRTILLAIKNKVKIGAHPSFPDKMGFGRREMELSKNEIYTSMLYQINAIKGIAESLGTKMKHVKLHGALYNMSALIEELAHAAFEAVKNTDTHLTIFGLPQSCHETVAKKLSLDFHAESFADRVYQDELKLLPRSEQGAVLNDPKLVAEQCLKLSLGEPIKSSNGKLLKIGNTKTICFHGDHPNILENLKIATRVLQKNGITVNKNGR